jgi:2-oxoglutarate dehydrogenase E1 component
MLQKRQTSFLFGDKVPYIEDLYESYLADTSSVSSEWRGYFAALQAVPAVDGSDKADVAHNAVIDKFAAMARRARPGFEGAAMALARNQDAWKVIEEDLRAVLPATAALHDACREASASTAPGYASLHLEQQARLVDNAFAA